MLLLSETSEKDEAIGDKGRILPHSVAANG